MRILGATLGIVILSLLALAPTANAITLTVTPPSGPIPYDTPTTLDVTIDGTCQEVLEDSSGASGYELQIVAASEMLWADAAGGVAPWTTEQCDLQSPPDFPAQTTGTITITPKNIAPALETGKVSVTVTNKEGNAPVEFQVAHFVSMNATTDRPAVPAGLGDSQPFNITLDVNTNAVSIANFTIIEAPKSGQVKGLEALTIEPAVSLYKEHHAGFFVWTDGGPDAGKPVSIKVPLTYVSSGTVWTAENLTIEVTLAAQKDPSLVSEPVTLSWTFEPTVTTEPDAESPAPDLLVVLLLLAVVFSVRARRA